VFEGETFMNIGPLVQEIYTAPSPKSFAATGESHARLLELRTDSGLLYVRPSGWQLIRLLWTFRHFHVLPPQLLSRGDQRLIETLSHSARVTPSLPVPRSAVFGVVENMHIEPDLPVVFLEEPARPVLRFPEKTKVWGMAISVCLILMLAAASAVFLLTRTPHVGKSAAVPAQSVRTAVPVASPTLPAAEELEHPAQLPDPMVFAHKSATANHLHPSVLDAAPAADPAVSVAPAGAFQRTLVVELPQGHLVQPVLSDPKLSGELQLRALISADGSVEEVTFMSGNPKLADAGMRAVRRWHYDPSQTPGVGGEREALIRMNFFGEDAVSITSVAR
jgi:hypothetical protein